MITIALVVAPLLDASPKPETMAKLAAREAPAQEGHAAPILAVAVTLECTARATGQVENCRVLGETHPGLGFGDAAMALMQDATVEPGDEDFQFVRIPTMPPVYSEMMPPGIPG